jgi:hypothetical protein
MSQPRLIGDIIADILADMREHDMDKVFEQEWTDVSDILRFPSIKSVELQINIGEGLIDTTRVQSRTYCKNSDIEKVYGTADFFVKIKKRNGK